MSTETVYWTPTIEETFLTLNPAAMRILTAIQSVKGQELDTEIYLILLSERVQRLMDQEPQGYQYLRHIMDISNLLTPWYNETAQSMIAENPPFREFLHLAGVMMPSNGTVLSQNDPASEEAVKETNLVEWIEALLQNLPAEMT